MTTRMNDVLRVLSVVMLVAAAGTPSLAGEHGKETLTRRLGDDLFTTGADVRIGGDIAGDAIAAGGEVTLDGTVHGDTVVAGGQVSLRGSSADDLYAAGGEVRLSGHVTGNARIAGGEVDLDRNAAIDGGASVSGGRVRVDGRVGRYLQIAAGSTRLDGNVAGDVDVAGGELIVGPATVVEGALTFRGPKPPRVAEGAQIRGGVTHVPERRLGKNARGALIGVAILWLLGWCVVGAVLLALWPGFSRSVSENVTRRTGLALLVGLAVLIGSPALIVLTGITVIGLPLALLLLAIYLVLFPFGFLASAVAIGDWLLVRMRRGAEIATRHRVLTLFGVLVALFLLTRIPVLGGLLCLLLLLAGMGSLVLAAVNRHRGAVTA